MSESEVIVNEQALASVSASIRTYVAEFRETIETAVRNLKTNASDWDDEDFNSLVSAINSFLTDVEGMENATNQLAQRIDTKISQIHTLHSMKI